MNVQKVGVIGVGGWGENHIKTYVDSPLTELVAVCDVNSERADRIAAEYRVPNVFPDYRDLLAMPDVDAVSIVTPDFMHAEITLAALAAGKHVLLEKPMATSIEECVSIREAVAASGCMFMVDFHNRWNPPFAKAKKAIEDGEIGRLLYAYYRLQDTIFVPTKMLSWAGQSTVNWFLASHCLDTLMWLFDDVIETVYTVSRSEVLKSKGIDTPDFYASVVQFRNGGVATLENGWVLPNTAPNIIDFKTEMIGTDGVLYTDGSHHRILQKYTQDNASYPDVLVSPTVHGKPTGFGIESIRAFAECIACDRQPMVGAEEGERVTRVILAMEESARTGAEVEVLIPRPS